MADSRNPWLDVPLADYEGHMGAPEVAQLGALADLFGDALAVCRPESVAIIGIAGGNGLDRVDASITKRIVGVDISQEYLDAVALRHGDLPLELHCVDLAQDLLTMQPVELAHAALIFEHAGVGTALENTLSCVKPGGYLAVVLQLPSLQAANVSRSGFDSMQLLAPHFQMIDPHEFTRQLAVRGFEQTSETRRDVPGGKAFWMGVFVSCV